LTALYLDGTSLIDNPDLVMFDKDGTLIDIHHYWGSMIRFRAERLTDLYFKSHPLVNSVPDLMLEAMGVNLKSGKLKPDGPVGVMPRAYIIGVVSEVAKSLGVILKVDDIEKVFLDVDQETSKNLLPFLRLLPGVEVLLSELKRNGIPIALVSTDITSRAFSAMKALKLDGLFNVILGGDSVKKTKPSPDLALAAISHCSANPLRTVVIGDHPVDIEMGRKAGCKTNIGVLNGISYPESFSSIDCILVSNLTHISAQ